jgi:molybdate transport system substrate-binding protein
MSNSTLGTWLVATTGMVLACTMAACGGDDSDSDGEGDSTTLTVYAAASLTSTFEELGADFEADHDGVTVEFSFAGSSDLVAQIQQGAPADVIATADTANMDKLVADDLLGADPVNFASNTLEIAVPPGNPAGVQTLQDLASPGLNLVICAPEVPCGAAAQGVAEAAGIELNPVSEEQSVTDVLNKVTTGEADAGLVYVTDVIAAGDDVQGITFPESAEVINVYPIATVGDSDEADLAQQFVDLVLSDTGQAALAEAGLGPT